MIDRILYSCSCHWIYYTRLETNKQTKKTKKQTKKQKKNKKTNKQKNDKMLGKDSHLIFYPNSSNKFNNTHHSCKILFVFNLIQARETKWFLTFKSLIYHLIYHPWKHYVVIIGGIYFQMSFNLTSLVNKSFPQRLTHFNLQINNQTCFNRCYIE